MNNFEKLNNGAQGIPTPPPSPFDGLDFDRIRAEALKDRPFGGPRKPDDSFDFASDATLNRADAKEERIKKDEEAAKALRAQIQGLSI